MKRKTTCIGALFIVCTTIAAPLACDNTDEIQVDCTAETTQAQLQARAGQVQSDGSVMVYGTVLFSDPNAAAELTVRAVDVAGIEVAPGPTAFNFREWSVSIPFDRIVAYAAGANEASLPVVARLYGGCIVELPVADEPLVRVIPPDGGLGDAAGLDASEDGPRPTDATGDGPTTSEGGPTPTDAPTGDGPTMNEAGAAPTDATVDDGPATTEGGPAPTDGSAGDDSSG